MQRRRRHPRADRPLQNIAETVAEIRISWVGGDRLLHVLGCLGDMSFGVGGDALQMSGVAAVRVQIERLGKQPFGGDEILALDRAPGDVHFLCRYGQTLRFVGPLQQALDLRPLPQGQGSLRPTFMFASKNLRMPPYVCGPSL